MSDDPANQIERSKAIVKKPVTIIVAKLAILFPIDK
jgi:hypothetical protein